jgi:uncharacterized protein YegJ (DUF2314 family)
MRRAAAIALALFVGSIASQAACSPEDDKAVWFKKHDPIFDAPTAEARSTLPVFWRHLAKDRGVEQALVKIGFPTAHGGVEFLWVGLTGFSDTSVRGKIVNEPEDVPNIHAGQPYEADISKITDWAYFKGGRSYGQFTTRVMLKAASPEERKAQLEALAPTPLEPGDH